MKTDVEEECSPSVLAAELRGLLSRLKRRLREQADTGDLTPSQSAALLRLERSGPAPVSELARAEGVRHQSMRTTVAALEAAGHVIGRGDPNDGRQTIISLTDDCRRWLAESRAARQDWLTRSIAVKLADREQATLAEAIRLLKRVVDE